MKIHYFNPGHETAVLNGSPYYMAPANVATMQHDLAFLPAWYGNREDVVLVEKSVNEYYASIYEKIPSLPHAITKNDLCRYKEVDISLWGISPQAIHYFEEIDKESELKLNIPQWREEYLYLNNRKTAHDCLELLCDQSIQIDNSIIPQFYTSLEEIDSAVKYSSCKLLAKAPYSSSGRGLLWLPVSELTRTENQILHGILKKQGAVSIERVLDKQIDFAMEFMSDGKGEVDFVGYSLFYTNAKGGYESNYIGGQEYIEQILCKKISPFLLSDIKQQLRDILAEKYGSLYCGCIGVDMMIYKEEDTFRLHPCVEINMRYNMGYLALCIQQNYLSENVSGRFYLDFYPREGDMLQSHIKMQELHPTIYKDGRLEKGYMSLCPITENTRYRAYVLIE